MLLLLLLLSLLLLLLLQSQSSFFSALPVLFVKPGSRILGGMHVARLGSFFAPFFKIGARSKMNRTIQRVARPAHGEKEVETRGGGFDGMPPGMAPRRRLFDLSMARKGRQRTRPRFEASLRKEGGPEARRWPFDLSMARKRRLRKARQGSSRGSVTAARRGKGLQVDQCRLVPALAGSCFGAALVADFLNNRAVAGRPMQIGTGIAGCTAQEQLK